MNQLNKHGTIPQNINNSENCGAPYFAIKRIRNIGGQCTKIFKYIYDALKKVVLSSVKSSAYWILKKMEEASDEIQKHMEVSWDETIIQAIKQ